MRYFAIHIILGLSLLLQIGALITQNAENVAGFLESNKFKAFSSLQDPSEFQNASPASWLIGLNYDFDYNLEVNNSRLLGVIIVFVSMMGGITRTFFFKAF